MIGVILSQHAILTRPTVFTGMALALKAGHITIFHSIRDSKLQHSHLDSILLIKQMSISILYIHSFSQLHNLLRALGNFL